MSDFKRLPSLTLHQRWELIDSLLQRQDRSKQAEQAFQSAYPNAPSEMIKTAVFHVYVDGIGAALDWLASAELFLRNPEYEIDDGTHLLYHLYNWQQFKALLPGGVEGMLEALKDLKAAIADEDTQAILEAAEDLEERLGGDLSAPQFYQL